MAKRKHISPDEQSGNKEVKRARGDPEKFTTSKPDRSIGGGIRIQQFEIPCKDKSITCERRGEDGKPLLIFTHGAGGGLSNAATKDFAAGFAEISPVVSFKGSMNLKGRVRSFEAVLDHEAANCALGGRSMGARAAVLTAQQSDSAIRALILVSYPLIGAQKGDSREQILLDLPKDIDVLFVSGNKDSMCDLAHLRRVMKEMKARSWLVEVEGADHGMNLQPKAASQPVVRRTGELAAHWLKERDAVKTYCSLSWEKSESKLIATGWQKE